MTLSQRFAIVSFIASVAVAVVMLGSMVLFLIGGPEWSLYCASDCGGMTLVRGFVGALAALAACGIAMCSETIQSFKGGTK
jgi:hypothetical protein